MPRQHSGGGEEIGWVLRHRIGAIVSDCLGQALEFLAPASDELAMAEIVNLRIARKRAARGKSERLAAERRLEHGAPKRERDLARADRDKARRTLDQHQIETGDRR
jgi:hypothetical protein